MLKCSAFVFGGGGARGALQVGAMRALLEAGIVPDLLVGTSIGAVNAAGLALCGVNLQGVDRLEKGWDEVSNAQLLDPRISKLILRAVLGRPSDRAGKKIEDFFVSNGIDRDLKFSQIQGVRLAIISADIESGQPVIYGRNLNDSILEGLMSSIALPPWFAPVHKDGLSMVDGGTLSNLPIEPALKLGATEIYSLDLDIPDQIEDENPTFRKLFSQYIRAMKRRHVILEKELAEAEGVPVYSVDFEGITRTPTWDFKNSRELIRFGYEKTCQKLAEWGRENPGIPAVTGDDSRNCVFQEQSG